MIAVITMAGRGKRFSDRGTDTPKPFIPVAGRPMVAWAFQSIAALPLSKVIFVALRDHSEQNGLRSLANHLAGDRGEVLELEQVTEGQLCTVLAARELINRDEELLVASADTLVESDLVLDIQTRQADCRGLISVVQLPGDHWSFAAVGPDGWVRQVAEKKRISPLASTGLYYFVSAREFVETAEALLADREKTCGEYYVMPVYQRYIDAGKKIGISKARSAWDMGTPESLRRFESTINARRSAGFLSMGE